MPNSTLPTASGPKELVLRALESAPAALDAYEAAKQAGVTPIQAGRTLAKLAQKGLARRDEQPGTDDELAARYLLVREADGVTR